MCLSFCVCAAGVRALAGINTLAVTNTWYMQDQNSTEIAYSGVKSNTEAGARAHGARAGGGAPCPVARGKGRCADGSRPARAEASSRGRSAAQTPRALLRGEVAACVHRLACGGPSRPPARRSCAWPSSHTSTSWRMTRTGVARSGPCSHPCAFKLHGAVPLLYTRRCRRQCCMHQRTPVRRCHRSVCAPLLPRAAAIAAWAPR